MTTPVRLTRDTGKAGPFTRDQINWEEPAGVQN